MKIGINWLLAALLSLTALGAHAGGEVNLYSARKENLIKPGRGIFIPDKSFTYQQMPYRWPVDRVPGMIPTRSTRILS